MDVVLGFSKVYDFPSMIILHIYIVYFCILRLHASRSPNVEDMRMFSMLFGCLLLMIFVVPYMYRKR